MAEGPWGAGEGLPRRHGQRLGGGVGQFGGLPLERTQFGFCERSCDKRPAQRAPGVAARIGLFLWRRRPVRPRVFTLNSDAHDLIAHHAGVIGLAVEGHITLTLDLLVEKPSVSKTYRKRLHTLPLVFRSVYRSNFH